jgi:hypothetical protein
MMCIQFEENIVFVEDENPGAAETKIRKIYLLTTI